MTSSAVGAVRRPLWFDATILCAPLFLLFVLTADYHASQMNDAASAFTSSWAVANHGTLDMTVSPAPKAWTVDVGNHVYSDRMPGVIAWGIPFYAVLGRTPAPTSFPAGVAASAATALAIAVLFVLLTRLVSRRTAAWSAVIFALATSTWSVSAHLLWPHGMDQLWLLLLLCAASSRRWWLAGLADAAAIVTRPTLAVVAAVVGIMAGWRARALVPTVKVGLAASVGVVALVVYNQAVFHMLRFWVGSYDTFAGSYTGSNASADATDPVFVLKNFAGALVSPARGLFVITPALILLLPGLRRGWQAAPGWARDAAGAGIALSVVQLLTNNFGGGTGFYGYRYTLETLTLCAPLLVMSWVHWTGGRPWRRWTFFALAGFSALSNLAASLGPITQNTAVGNAWKHYQLTRILPGLSTSDWVIVAAATITVGGVVLVLSRSVPEVDDESNLGSGIAAPARATSRSGSGASVT